VVCGLRFEGFSNWLNWAPVSESCYYLHQFYGGKDNLQSAENNLQNRSCERV